MVGFEHDQSDFRFAQFFPEGRHLDSVVDRVADKMGEGIVDGLDNGFVQLDVLADDGKIDGLIEFFGKIPDNSRKFVEDIADRLHAGQHDRFLQFRGYQIDALTDRFRVAQVVGADGLEQLIPAEDQLSGKIHQRIEQAHMHPESCLPLDRRSLLFAGNLSGEFDDRAIAFRFLVEILVLRFFLETGHGVFFGEFERFRFFGRQFRFKIQNRLRFLERRFRFCRRWCRFCLRRFGFFRRCGRRLRECAVGYSIEGREVGGNVDFVAVMYVFDHALQLIRSDEQNVDDLRRRNQLFAANHAEHIFRGVRQFLNGRQAHKPRTALNRVRSPKNLVDEIFVDIGACFLDG